ncbi:MAG: ATP-binding protein [Helicobacteraceae bacterium]|jgi:predicted AAA+ superfamily ATPase|nr:ATP-binding protein [Helicobacteraceae bacterium]
MYIKRTIEAALKKVSGFFPITMVTGPRQVGKTTVLQNCDPKREFISLDNLNIRQLAKSDPLAFLRRFKAPILIDEIQYAPELLPHIKEIVDREQKAGLYWITGSQQFNLMRNVTESLAGRVGILKLQGLSQSEKQDRPYTSPFLPSVDLLRERAKINADTSEIYKTIWLGSFPKLFTGGNEYWEIFYSSYLNTYIERDISDFKLVSSALDFTRFMQSLAARTAQLLNYADLAKDVGVSQPTIKSWISILQSCGVIYLLPPYSNNLTNRAIKTPKVYFLDTGLACYLTKWNFWQTLEAGAMSGAIFETYVVSEILKSYWHNGKNLSAYFYRNKDSKENEIDMILEENGAIYPIEIKRKTNPTNRDAKSFALLRKINKNVKTSVIICNAPTYLPIGEDIYAMPISYI